MKQSRQQRKSTKTIEDLTEQLRRVRIIEAALKASIEAEAAKISGTSTNQKTVQVHQVKDHHGVKIELGDTVVFLTKGGYHAQGGKVVRFTKSFVVTKDERGNEIRRKPCNLRVTHKHE